MMTKIALKKIPMVLLAGCMTVAAPAQATRLQDAERMIARCFDYAASQKLTPLSVGVIDASGTIVAFRRQDGASSGSAEAALLKARTSARLNAPTAVLAPVAASDASTRDAFLIMQMTSIPGGVPLTDEAGRTAGAIGVSGAAPEQDAECARRAAEPAQAKKN